MTDRQRQLIEHRMSQANVVIAALAAHGSRAFYSVQYELTGYFYVDSAMQGWWVDFITGIRFETNRAADLYGDAPKRILMRGLLSYIRTGKPIDATCLERFDYPAEEFAKVWEAVSGLELINRKKFLTE